MAERTPADGPAATGGGTGPEPARGGRDRGSGTVLVIGGIGALVALVLGGLALVCAVEASTRARTAADLGALAAAQVVVSGPAPAISGGVTAPADELGSGWACASAERVAHANGARLQRCSIQGEEVMVVVAARARWPGLADATARSRAGPEPLAAR